MKLMNHEKIETLKSTEYLDLKKISNDNIEYFYSHDRKSRGEIVAVLPYMRTEDKENDDITTRWFLARQEFVPCWSIYDYYITSITGGIENSHRIKYDKIYPRYCAVDELQEETGYIKDFTAFQYLGQFRLTKSTDTIAYLYSVEIKNNNEYDSNINGDGSIIESMGSSVWLNYTDIISSSPDPLLFTCLFKMIHNYDSR